MSVSVLPAGPAPRGRGAPVRSGPAPPETPVPLPTMAPLELDLGPDGRAGDVHDVLGLVEEAGHRVVAAVEGVEGFVGGAGGHERAVGPVDVGHPRLEASAVGRAPPGCLGRQVEVALPHGLAVAIGAALEVLAV